MDLDVISAKRPTKWKIISYGLAIADLIGLKKAKLVPKKIIEDACKLAKSDNHQLEGVFMDGYERLIWSINEEAGMDSFGLHVANLEVTERVYNRIRLNDEIAKQKSTNFPKKQLFVIGFPRTGSTHLHNLLSQEEGSRTPRMWELFYPVPYPRYETYDTDERVAKLDEMLKQLDKLAPLSRKIHPMEADLPEECHNLMGIDFAEPGLCLYYNVPTYWEWIKTLEVDTNRVIYECYERYIKYLCTEIGGNFWLSKSSAHIMFYWVLKKIFPEAKIVRLHRDPCESIPSFASLLACNWQIYSNKLQIKAAGKQVLDMYKIGMERAMEGDKLINSDSFIDVHYEDVVKKPIETLTGIYNQFDYPISDELVGKWQKYLDDHPKNKTGRHVYTLEQFGLSKKKVHGELDEYFTWLKKITGRLV